MKFKLIIFLITVVFSYNFLISQNNQDRLYIKKNSNILKLEQLKNKFNLEYKEMLSKAKDIGLPIFLYSKRKKVGALSGIKNGVPYYDFNNNLNSAKTNRVDKIWDGGATGLNLTGNGVTIGLWEATGMPLTTHVELSGKVFYQESGSPSSHATHVAGTLVATGVNSDAKGMASSAIIHARTSSNDESEMANFASNGGILSNHSYGSDDPNGNLLFYGYYSNKAKAWDEISYNAPYYLIVKSVGNNRNDGVNPSDGGYDILFSMATSKNPLIVGAVDDVVNYSGPNSVNGTDFSSYGPTDDWRIKPDIVANGKDVFSTNSLSNTSYINSSGTSMAAPSITGAIALLQQHYHNKNNVYMKSATAKALIINSTDEVGANPGPDFAYGWGLMNAENAASIISNNNTSSLILEKSLANNQTFEFTIDIDGTKPLSLTMAWTDVAAEPIPQTSLTVDQSDLRLINDLDVRIIGNGNTYKPWIIEAGSFSNTATKGDNFRDNIEKIEVDNIPSGTYTVKVTHKGQLFNSNNQEFSIVVNNIASSSLNIEDVLQGKVNVFPNPVKENTINIQLNKDLNSFVGVSLYNVNGRLIKKQKFNNTSKVVFKVPKSFSGLYFLNINTVKGSFMKKIIIE